NVERCFGLGIERLEVRRPARQINEDCRPLLRRFASTNLLPQPKKIGQCQPRPHQSTHLQHRAATDTVARSNRLSNDRPHRESSDRWAIAACWRGKVVHHRNLSAPKMTHPSESSESSARLQP